MALSLYSTPLVVKNNSQPRSLCATYDTGVVALREEQHEHAQEPNTVQDGRHGSVSVRAKAVFRGERNWRGAKKCYTPSKATSMVALASHTSSNIMCAPI